MSRKIPLSQGRFALVDDADYGRLRDFAWWARRGSADTWYAARTLPTIEGVRGGTARMHREILQPPAGVFVDHINGDGLDNRRVNLRFCTCAENNRNARLRQDSRTGFKGIGRSPNGLWFARITVEYRARRMVGFQTAEQAALAYDKLAIQHFGEFACLNFPEAA